MTAKDVRVLPEPDSPTMQVVEPSQTLQDTPFTTGWPPSKAIRRSRRERRTELLTWGQRVPRFSCSRSIASKRALKLPLPKLLAPLRWMISKNIVGRSTTGLVKSCSR